MFKTAVLEFILCNPYCNPVVQILRNVRVLKVCTSYRVWNTPTQEDSAIKTYTLLSPSKRYKLLKRDFDVTPKRNFVSYVCLPTNLLHLTTGNSQAAMWCKYCSVYYIIHTHTHTHTHIYIYIYIFMTSLFSFPYFKLLYKHF